MRNDEEKQKSEARSQEPEYKAEAASTDSLSLILDSEF
jgi:hypothetical protein